MEADAVSREAVVGGEAPGFVLGAAADGCHGGAGREQHGARCRMVRFYDTT
jgi:hypothetical protein